MLARNTDLSVIFTDVGKMFQDIGALSVYFLTADCGDIETKKSDVVELVLITSLIKFGRL